MNKRYFWKPESKQTLKECYLIRENSVYLNLQGESKGYETREAAIKALEKYLDPKDDRSLLEIFELVTCYGYGLG